MRLPLYTVCLLAFTAAGGTSKAQCSCPSLSLDDRIAGSTFIFTGRAVTTAQIPPGMSPFHSERTLEQPRIVDNDLVTLFRIETVWKGESRKTVRVRHSQGDCAAHFDADVPTVVFAQLDQTGVLWTQLCSGNLDSSDSGFPGLENALASRLKYN
jgi:hypothetical protein